MKTNEVKLTSEQFDPQPALTEVEKCASYMGLDGKKSLQLRLLGEELLGMMKCILGEYTAKFWLTTENSNVELHMSAKTSVGDAKLKKLMDVSTSGENEAHKGIMGKIRQVVEECLFGDPENPEVYYPYYSYMEMGSVTPISWSLHAYEQDISIKRDEDTEQWDELEKSIVAKLADDVVVAARKREVEIVIKKSF